VSAQHRLLRALTGGWKPLLMGLVAVGVLAPAAAAHADPSVQQIEAQITAQSTQLEKIIEQYNKVTEELKASQAAAAKANADLGPLTDQLNSASTRVGAIAASAYKGAPLAQVSGVFEASDPSAVVDRLATLDQVTKFENGQLQNFAATKTRTDAEKAKLDKLVADQATQRQSLDNQKKKITADVAQLQALRIKVYGVQKPSVATPSTPPAYVAGKAGTAVKFAYAQLGKPYEWAAEGPNSYDCSGLTLAAWRAAGVTLPHSAEMQYNSLPHVSRAALQPGDLVFYSNLGHVGIYVGNSQIIHAPTSGDHVRVASVDMMPPYGYARPR
jgi:cell wall-associated NlpC family hydrolase